MTNSGRVSHVEVTETLKTFKEISYIRANPSEKYKKPPMCGYHTV